MKLIDIKDIPDPDSAGDWCRKNGFGMERMPCGQTEAKEIRRRIFELSLVLDG